MKLKSLLVGTGGWAETHIRAYQNCAEIELVGLCGHRSADKLNALADQYAIPERGLDLRELLDRVQPDVLDVACNPHFRLQAVQLAIMQPSVKLINLEKPLALTPADAYAIERLCLDNDKLLTVNHQKKYLPAWHKAAQLIADGVLGDVQHIRATCQGNLLEQGTHLVDMTLYFMGYRPVSWVMGQIDALEGLEKEGASAPDAAMALLCFDNDVRANITFGSIGHSLPGESNKWHQFAIEVHGSRGHLCVTLNKTLETLLYDDGRRTIEESSWDKHYVYAVAQHLDAVARYARNPTTGHISDLEHSLASFQVIMAIYASGCGEGQVHLPRRFDDSLLDRLRQLRAN
ncbi:MAG: Gfo/Idh/MocA family oxidoreductase [Chloroflexi bacterium]|jgi:predicted dehydrogenase|nr:Gfo/Idh/MocA family oxidoreductase [Chloroflexota bacterium]